MGTVGQTNFPLAFLSLQNQDGVCVQSVSVILHQDPRRQVTLTQAGDVLLFDQYKVTPPYTDGMALVDKSSLGAGFPGLFFQAPLNEGTAVWAGAHVLVLGKSGWGVHLGPRVWALSPPHMIVGVIAIQ